MKKKWKVLTRELVVDNQWVTITKETARNGVGTIVEGYYVTSLGDIAMILAITEDGGVPIVREYRHGCRDYVWQLPGGGIGNGETALEAAKRELLEETGYEADTWRLLASWYISSPRMPDRQFVFVAQGAYKVKEPDSTEEITLKMVNWEEAVRMTLAGEIKDPHSCTAILWVDRQRGNNEDTLL